MWFHESCVRHWSCSPAWHISTFPWWSKRWFPHDWFVRPWARKGSETWYKSHSRLLWIKCLTFPVFAASSGGLDFIFGLRTCQFYECRRKRESWQLFLQSPAAKYNHPGSGHNFSWWTAGGKRTSEKNTLRRLGVGSALVDHLMRKWKAEFLAGQDTHIHHLIDVLGYGVRVVPGGDAWTPLCNHGRFVLSCRLYMREEQRMHEGLRKRNRKKAHAHHITWFSNVLHFDVAHFDIIQRRVWLFVLKMLHPQPSRARERLSLCETRL